MASNTYSPPVLDSSLIPSLQPADGSLQLSNQLNGEKIDQNENFIISSLHSETNDPHFSNIDHPLSISTSNHNSFSESSLNPNGLGGLTRQPSMKKKVPVNYDMLLHNSYEKDEESEKLSNNQQLNNIDEDSKRLNDTNNKILFNSDILRPDDNATNSNSLNSEEENAWSQSFPMNNGESRPIDMKVIEPYKKVISHGGYMHASADGRNIEGSSPAIIIFSACYLPDRSRKDYAYVMDNLFMYVLTTLHNMIADDYILIYLHNGGMHNSGNNMPTFGWLKRCYQMIDRRLKKNLKGLYILHPTFWLKTLIIMSKPFISSKFSRKLKFVRSLEELRSIIPIEHVAIPEPVKIYDQLVASLNR